MGLAHLSSSPSRDSIFVDVLSVAVSFPHLPPCILPAAEPVRLGPRSQGTRLGFFAAMVCKYLHRGERCFKGCTPKWTMCHHFVKRGWCRYGDRCRRHHSPPRPEAKTDKGSFDDRRPDWNTTPRHVRIALDVLNICTIRCSSVAVVDAIAKALLKQVHPDKHPGASGIKLQKLNQQTAQVQQARETLVAFLNMQDKSGAGSDDDSRGSGERGQWW